MESDFESSDTEPLSVARDAASPVRRRPPIGAIVGGTALVAVLAAIGLLVWTSEPNEATTEQKPTASKTREAPAPEPAEPASAKAADKDNPLASLGPNLDLGGADAGTSAAADPFASTGNALATNPAFSPAVGTAYESSGSSTGKLPTFPEFPAIDLPSPVSVAEDAALQFPFSFALDPVPDVFLGDVLLPDLLVPGLGWQDLFAALYVLPAADLPILANAIPGARLPDFSQGVAGMPAMPDLTAGLQNMPSLQALAFPNMPAMPDLTAAMPDLSATMPDLSAMQIPGLPDLSKLALPKPAAWSFPALNFSFPNLAAPRLPTLGLPSLPGVKLQGPTIQGPKIKLGG